MADNINLLRTDNFYAVYKNTANEFLSFQHYHNSYEIEFFLNINVNLEIFIRDMRYEIRSGDVIFINEFDIHHFIYNNNNTAYTRFVINFKKDYILPNLKAAGIEYILEYLNGSRYTHASTTLKERNELESLFKTMININDSNLGTLSKNFKEATLKSYLILILMRIWELIKNYKPQKSMSKKGKLAQDIIQYIDINYMSEVNLDLLEKAFFVDKYHLSHNFKEVTNFSIMEYVQHKRIIEAQKMLKYSEKEIIDICFDCGFNNIQHFHRVFKKISGMTPDKYRKL
jgi:AraC-type DNA-binding domain-containing proteins